MDLVVGKIIRVHLHVHEERTNRLALRSKRGGIRLQLITTRRGWVIRRNKAPEKQIAIFVPVAPAFTVVIILIIIVIMASKTGSFLKASDRQKILLDLQQKGELALGNVPESVRKEVAEVMIHNNNGNHHHNNCGNAMILAGEQFGTGCLACGEDDDHANLLLCEACNAEYHTYVRQSPVQSNSI